MADIEEITLNGKPLSKLRVVDLKQELDQRGLSKAGSKVELMERLRAQMVLEKRHSEAHAASSGDEAKAPNLALQDDAVTGQNDFIKQYLLQQQRSLERQMEIKKKVEEELKRQSADESTDESQDSTGEEEVTPIVMTSKSEVKVVQDAPAGGSSDTEMAKNRRSRQHSKEEKSDASKKESNKATNEKGDADSTEPVVKKSRRQKSPEESEMRRHHRSGSSSRSRSNTPDKDRHFGKGKKVGHRHRHDRGSSSHSPSPKPRDREDSKHVSKRNRSSRNSHSKSKSPEPRRSNRRSTVHSTKATKSLHQVTENPDAEELRDVAFDSKEEKLVTDKETEISSHHKSPKRREDLANRSPRKSPGCSRQFNEKDDKLNENSSNKSAIVEIELPAGESPRKSPSLSSEQAEKKETDEVEKLVRKSKTDLEEFTSLNTATPRVSRWHQESTEKETEPQNRIKSPASLEEKKKEDSCKQSDDSPEHRETTQTDANLEKKIEMVEKTSSKSEDIQHPEVGDSHSIEKEGKNSKSFRKEKENIDVQFEIQEKISDKPSSAQEEPQKVSLPKRSWRSKSKEDVATSKKQKIEDLPKEQVIEKPSEGAAIAGEKEHTSEISKDLNEVDKVTSQKSQKSERRKSFETCTMTKQGQVDPSIFEIQAVSVITSEQESESKKSCLTLPEVPQQEQEMNVSQKEEIDSRNPPKRKNQEGLKDSSYIKKRSSKEHLVELHDSKIKTKSHSRSSSGSQSPVANERTGRQRKREKKSSSSSQSHSENKTTSSSSSRSRSRSGSKSFSSGLEEETSKTLKGKVHTIQRKKERSSSPSARKKNEAEKMHIDEAPEEKKSIEAKEREYFKQRQPGSPSKVSARSSEKEAEKASGKNDGEKDETRNVRSLRLGSTQKASADDVSKSEGNTEEHIVSLKEKPARRRKWGSSQSKSTASKQRTSTLEISTDSLKGLIEEVHLPTEPVLELEAGETMFLEQDDHDKRDVKVKRTVIMREGEENIENVRRVETSDNPHTSQNTSKEEKEKAPVSKKVKVEKHTPDKKKGVKKEQPSVEQKKTSEPIIAVRRVSQPLVAPDEPETSSRTLSPPRRPVSCVVHVMNLVRPFTVSQLKQLLGRTGKLIESGFWINSIKSHCYVTYEKEDDAVKTREALHGARWPQSNPKLLRVDFASAEEIERHRTEEEGGPAPPRPQPAPQPRAPSPPPVKEKRPAPEPEKKRDERPVREWDRGKRSRSLERGPVVRTRSRSRDRARDKERERERERRHREQERVKEKKEKKSEMPKVEEEPPAKLLDDLFRKTKATPCIYWLPLTDEQYQQRFQQRTRERLERAAEREKRRELEDAEEEAARKKAVEMRRRDGPNSPARDRPEKEGPRLRDSDNSRSRDRDRDRERLARERNRDEDRDRRKPVRSDSRDRNIRQERSASGSRDRRRR